MYRYKIAEARRAKGWSQQQLGELIGKTQQAVQRYEAGERDIRASILIKLSEVLEVTVTYLLGMTDPTPTSSNFFDVPLYGTIAAGKPIDMDATYTTYPIPILLHDQYPNAFLLRVEGESMNHILPNGCYALIDPCETVDYNGQPYAISTEEYAATIKRVYQLDAGIRLDPDSTDRTFTPQVLAYSSENRSTISVIGRVVWHCIPYEWRY